MEDTNRSYTVHWDPTIWIVEALALMTGKNRRDESARIAIARIVDFAICFHQFRRGVEIYGMFRPAIFSKLDIIEIGDFRKTRFSNLDMSQEVC